MPIEAAWSFFSDPRNLTRITPASLRLEITSELPEQIHPGLIITYRVRPLFGIPVTWITEITHVVKPYLFVDEQRAGPYRFWHHQHLFKEVPNGIEMKDVVHYSILFEPLGTLINSLYVAGQLRGIFDYRRQYLEEFLRTGRDYVTDT
jgi:ligand-binding SRPBCC domain-containing protein